MPVVADRGAPAPGVAGPGPLAAAPTAGPLASDPRSGKDIAASFVNSRVTNPLIRARSGHEDRRH
jgi:hypothetical protein